jgi:ankyrin repeat protein
MLLNTGSDVHARSVDGHTPLFWAARLGHFESFRILVNVGGDALTRMETVAPCYMMLLVLGNRKQQSYWWKRWGSAFLLHGA